MAPSLPKYVAFKGDNGKYLEVHSDGYKHYFTFSADKYEAQSSKFETMQQEPGYYKFKFSYNNYILVRMSDEWIVAVPDVVDYGDNSIFYAESMGEKSYTLLNMGNKKYCQRYSDDCTKDYLKAATWAVVPEAIIVVEDVGKRS